MSEPSPPATLATAAPRRAPKDYASDQEVRWCPGCGDYAVLRAVERALSELGADPDRTVFVSGIGCAARFPHYLAAYGFHGIHGRAPVIATGIKLARPELDVWVVGGDGDMLAIGTNHLVHTLRRDVDLVILILNNEVYGLTKGQASPTTPIGTRTASTPSGAIERPLSACSLALAAGARFVARAVDVHPAVSFGAALLGAQLFGLSGADAYLAAGRSALAVAVFGTLHPDRPMDLSDVDAAGGCALDRVGQSGLRASQRLGDLLRRRQSTRSGTDDERSDVGLSVEPGITRARVFRLHPQEQ